MLNLKKYFNTSILTTGLVCLLFLFISMTVMAEEEPWERIDFGGETVTIYHSGWFHPSASFITGEEWEDPRWEEHLEWVEDVFNVEVVFDTEANPWGAGPDISEMVMAGESNFVFATSDFWVPILANEGLIYPLGDILDDDYYDRLPDILSKPLRAANKFKGEPYAMQFGPVMHAESRGVFWNKDLFEEEGLENPYELMENGKWTWDAFRDIAIEATKDTSGDGEIDQWGIENRDWATDAIMTKYWGYTNTARSVKEVDGKFIWSFDEPEAIEALEFWQELVAVEETVSDSAWGEEFTNGNVAMTTEFTSVLSSGFPDMEDEYGLVPLPRGPEAEDHIAPEFGRWVMVIPITAQDPEALMELHHALYKVAEPYVEKEELEKEYFEEPMMNARDAETIEYFEWTQYNAQPNRPVFWQVLAEVPEYGEIFGDVAAGEISPAEAMAEIKPAAQSRLDDVFEQH